MSLARRKRSERKALLEHTENFGSDAAMRCSFCVSNDRRCIMTTSTSRCSECVRGGRPGCDGKPEFLDGWEALVKQEEKLKEEEEEAMAKILCLRK